MHRIIAGGTGLIGKRLVEKWLPEGGKITIIGRSKAHIEEIFGTKVEVVTWDAISTDTLKSAQAIINLTGENVGLKRWNEAQKKEILNSRIESTKKIATLLAEMGAEAPPLFNASAMGIYGLQKQTPNQLPPKLDENTVIDWAAYPDFLAEVGRRWEKAAEPAVTAGVRVIFLRFGIVLAKEGGALPMIMKPFQFYLGGPIGTGEQPFSWVAIDDVVNAIDFLVAKSDSTGAYNIVAPGTVHQRAVGEILGRVMNKPDIVKLPAFMAKLMMGEQMASELLLEGQRAYPMRLLEAGFKFTYPELEPAIKHVLK